MTSFPDEDEDEIVISDLKGRDIKGRTIDQIYPTGKLEKQ